MKQEQKNINIYKNVKELLWRGTHKKKARKRKYSKHQKEQQQMYRI